MPKQLTTHPLNSGCILAIYPDPNDTNQGLYDLVSGQVFSVSGALGVVSSSQHWGAIDAQGGGYAYLDWTFDPSQHYTLSIWIRIPSTSPAYDPSTDTFWRRYGFCSIRNASNEGISLQTNPNYDGLKTLTSRAAWIKDDGTNDGINGRTGDLSPLVDVWVHLVGVYGVDAANKMSAYYNGVRGVVNTKTILSRQLTRIELNAVGFNNPNQLWRRFNGFISAFRVYNRALTDQEIAGLYQQGLVGDADLVSAAGAQSVAVGVSTALATSYVPSTARSTVSVSLPVSRALGVSYEPVSARSIVGVNIELSSALGISYAPQTTKIPKLVSLGSSAARGVSYAPTFSTGLVLAPSIAQAVSYEPFISKSPHVINLGLSRTLGTSSTPLIGFSGPLGPRLVTIGRIYGGAATLKALYKGEAKVQ